ncbi:MAG: hypothetical protein IJ523_05180 [Succinivibrionaceae bacterium]|nr:hypothetical protein [Succinivibrionaceae bacterium]
MNIDRQTKQFRTKAAAALCAAMILCCGCDDSNDRTAGSTPVKSIKRDTNRARFAEAAIQAEALKRSVYLCLAEHEMNIDDNPCSSGARGDTYSIPGVYSTTYFDSVEVKLGSIIMTAGHKDTLNGETYILDPVASGNSVIWQLAADSTCLSAGYC